ncbi:hypothetical protein [Thalassotalea aquiviva]|uniref:hypothetical protein n=1 Tax=Thalassotalea aquiviva TaxID=3242415 RepID=UPI00352A8574
MHSHDIKTACLNSEAALLDKITEDIRAKGYSINRHLDAFQGQKNRVLSMVLFLN